MSSLSEASPLRVSTPPRTIPLGENASPYMLRELTPGGSYQVQLFSVYDNKESVAYISRNFTTSKLTFSKESDTPACFMRVLTQKVGSDPTLSELQVASCNLIGYEHCRIQLKAYLLLKKLV